MRKNSLLFYISTLLFCFSLVSCLKHDAYQIPVVNCYPGYKRMDTAVLLVLGQSNAANFGNIRYTANCEQAINFYQGNYYPLSDPLKGALGEGGSVWSRLGDLLLQSGFAGVVIIAPVAIGGTSVQQWKPGGVNNHLITETITSLYSKGLKITHVLWHQGENNNANLYPSVSALENAQQYRIDFMELVAQLRSLGVDAPVFPAITSRCGKLQSDIFLEQAQRELANDSMGIYNGPDTDLLGNEYRYDACHFNEEGLRLHALLWANILFTH